MRQVDARRVLTAGCEACSAMRGGDQILSTKPARIGWGKDIWPLVCGALFLAVPKCPLCLAAWLGALGVAGAGGATALHGRLRVGLAAAFAVALAGFAINAWRRRDVRPLLVAIVGAIAAWTSQTVDAHGVLRSASLVLLAVAAVWNTMLLARTRRSMPSLTAAKPSRI